MKEQPRIPTLFIDPMFQIFTMLLLMLALYYRQRSLIFLALLLLVLVNGAKLWCRLSLRKVDCHLKIHRAKVFPAEAVNLMVEVENTKPLPVRLQFSLPLSGLSSLTGSSLITRACGLLWYQKVVWELELTTGGRGVYRLGPPHLAAGDLFGFFQRGRNERFTREVVVYPRLLPLAKFPFLLSDLFGRPGAKSPVEDPAYPVATREYQHGRPARHIHWKASARHSRLQEKIFEPTSQSKTLLMVDVEAYAEKNAEQCFEDTLEAVASLGVMLESKGGPVGLLTNGSFTGEAAGVLPVGKGQQQLAHLLETLARLKMEPEASIKDMLLQLKLSSDLACIYFSYDLNSTALLNRAILNEYNIPVVFIIGVAPSNLNDLPGNKVYRLQDVRGAVTSG